MSYIDMRVNNNNERNKYQTCTLWFCDEPHYARGLCATHYQNWRRTGGSPIKRYGYDLRIALHTVELYRKVVSKLVDFSDFYETLIEGGEIVKCMCLCCGESAQFRQFIQHKPDCEVRIGEMLVANTESHPPEDAENTYSLDMDISWEGKAINSTKGGGKRKVIDE